MPGKQDQTQAIPGMEVSELSVSDLSPADYLELMNGRVKLPVSHVSGEHVVQMRGTVPAEWSLS